MSVILRASGPIAADAAWVNQFELGGAVVAIANQLVTQGADPNEVIGAGGGSGLLPTVFDNPGSLPDPNTLTAPAWAIVDNGTDYPDVYWLQVGGIPVPGWQQSTYPWPAPPDPLGSWVFDADDNSIGAGNNTSTFWMGFLWRVNAPGVGLDALRVAFKGGAAAVGSPREWEIRFSTAPPSLTPPALTTYTNIVLTGTVTPTTAGVWEQQTLGAPLALPVLNTHGLIWWRSGPGWQSVNIGTLSGSQLDQTFVTVLGGCFLFSASPTPGVPTGQSATIAYGIASMGIG